MRRFPRQATGQQRVQFAPELDIPSPVGGLNTRDNLGDMPITDALELVNWLPSNQSVKAREGYTVQADDLTGETESLLVYKNGTVSKMIAAVGGGWEEVPSIAGDPSSTVVAASTFTNDRWQSINVGGFLFAVNGADAPRHWDGTTVTTPTFTGDITTPTAATMDGIHLYKNRVYLWDTDDSDFYYGATNAISGAFTKFQLGQISKTGGNLMCVKTLSFDAGDGLDDVIVFFLDTGETLIYTGSDPASDLAIVGTYYLPPPLSVRSAVEFAGDIRILTEADTISMLDYLRGEGKEQRLSKLAGAVKSEVSLYKSLFGWESIWFNAGDLLIYNVPNIADDTYVQYVTNTSTGASTKLEGYNARCFAVWDNELYFGDTNAVYKAFDGQTDNGSNINLTAQQAYSTLGIQGEKRLIAYELLIGSEGALTINLGVGYNYAQVNVTSAGTSTAAGTLWDAATSLWDVAPWSGGNDVRISRFGLRGSGLAVSVKFTVSVQNQTPEWYRSTYVYEQMVAR